MESFEKGSMIRSLSDGGYIITGETESYNLPERDMLLMRTDSSGNVIWTKSYGGNEREVVNDVTQTPDNGFLFIAEKYQPDKAEGEFLTLIKTDAIGKMLWKKIFDEGGNETEGFSLQPTPDKNYIIAGMTKSMNVVSSTFFTMRAEDQGVYLLKVDGSGSKIWSRKFYYGADNISSTATSVIIAKDGTYMITGNIAKKGKTDKKIEKPAQVVNMQDMRTILFAKVKPNGTLHWAMEYEANQIAMGYSVIEKKDGGFLVLGNTNISKTDMEIFIMSIDENGKILWAKTYGGIKFESAADIVETPDRGFVTTGITESFGSGASDVLLFKIDTKGNILWAKTYGGKNEEYPSKIALAKDGIVVVGSSASFNSESFDVLLFKTDWNGNSECLGKNTILNVKNFQPVSGKIEKAEMKKVEQGVTPPNMKKADTQNITEYKREVRTKKICN